jgi:molybdenum cofactor cytidylyltransferase
MSSVHAGLNAMKEACDAVLVCLSDQPLLEADDITALLDAFAHRTTGAVLVPVYRGQRGNPVILDAVRRAAILSGARNLGCKHLIENNPELVCTVEMENDHAVVDLDTPDAYAAVLARLGEPPARMAM